MISFEKFTELFKPIIDWDAKYDREVELLKQLYPSSFVVPEDGKLCEAYITLLEELVGDEDKWIDYFVWACELGKQPKAITINNVHEVYYKLDSVKALYDLLVHCEKDRKRKNIKINGDKLKITIEGTIGSGKTTVQVLLDDYFTKRGATTFVGDMDYFVDNKREFSYRYYPVRRDVLQADKSNRLSFEGKTIGIITKDI